MAEEEEVNGCARCNGSDEWSNPENDWMLLLQKRVLKRLEKHLDDVLDCIIANVRDNQLQAVKILLDLARWAGAGKAATPEMYQSFAKALWGGIPEEVRNLVLGTGKTE